WFFKMQEDFNTPGKINSLVIFPGEDQGEKSNKANHERCYGNLSANSNKVVVGIGKGSISTNPQLLHPAFSLHDIKDDTGYKNCGKHGYNNTQGQCDGKTLDGTGSKLKQDQCRNQGGQVGIKDGHKVTAV